MKDDQKKMGKLATYSVIMLLTAIIIIIIAAMADNREEMFQSQIEQKTQTNMTIQNEIVALKDENYNLKQENDKLKGETEDYLAKENVSKAISDALMLYNENKVDESKAKLGEINTDTLQEVTLDLYNVAKQIINSKK